MNRQRIIFKQRFLVAGFFLLFSHIASANSLHVPQKDAKYQSNEFKLIVTAVSTDKALEKLGLTKQNANNSVIYFFDSDDKKLQAQNLILRARQSGNKLGDSTVKIRVANQVLKLNDQELALPIEYDWVNAVEPIESRSLTYKQLDRHLLSNVANGLTPVANLFTQAQRNLLETRIPSFNWENLKHYGPIKAVVWTRQVRLTGFAEDMTVELWHLTKNNHQQEILEISAKVQVETKTEAQAQAQLFFAAAKDAGLGVPNGKTKTILAMDFFKSDP